MTSLRPLWFALPFCLACTSFEDAETSQVSSNAGGQGGNAGAGPAGSAGKGTCTGEVCPAGNGGAAGKAGSGGAGGAGQGGAGQAGAGSGQGGAGAGQGGAGQAGSGQAGSGATSTGGSAGSGGCTEGATSCQVGVVQKCDKGQWVLVENCLAQPQTACEGGKCVPLPSCGNSACDPNESECTCPKDCGQPGCGECGNPACVVCGDGKCEGDESCGLCPQDCGKCCGNGACEPVFAETKCSCPQDCGASSCGECGKPPCPTCGNGQCDGDENCGSCPQDCGKCCGDGKCEPVLAETKCSCPQDCGASGCGECGNPACIVCGDGKCDASESCGSCEQDCGLCCGNGKCDNGETCESCAGDCGVCAAVCGNSKVEQGEQCDGAPADCSALGPYKPGSAPCGPACQADLSGCVLASCGNGTKDASEECDGPLAGMFCAEIYKDAQGMVGCLSSCKFDLSACQYCGDGKLAPHEACDGSIVPANCSSIGAGDSGQLACNKCQLDTSACSSPSCGYTGGLLMGARWAIQDGCVRRPRRSSLGGPASATAPSPTPQIPPAPQLVEPLADSTGNLFFAIGDKPARYNGASVQNSNQTAGNGPLVGMAILESSIFALFEERALRFDLNGLGKMDDSTVFPGLPSGPPLVVGPDVGGLNGYTFFPAENSIIRLANDNLNKQDTFFKISAQLGGTMAYDSASKTLFVAERSCSSCRVFAIEAQTGAKLWEEKLPAGGDLHHVTLAASGVVYLTGGGPITRFNPKTPGFHSSKNSSSGDALRPAVAPDGSLFVAFARTNQLGGPSSLNRESHLLETMWTVPIFADILAPPLLDSADNVYVCTSNAVVSFDKSGNQRWSAPMPASTTCSLLISTPGALDVFRDSGHYRL